MSRNAEFPVVVTDEEIRADDRVQRAELAIRDLIENHGLDALFGEEGRSLSARLGAVRVSVALQIHRARRDLS